MGPTIVQQDDLHRCLAPVPIGSARTVKVQRRQSIVAQILPVARVQSDQGIFQSDLKDLTDHLLTGGGRDMSRPTDTKSSFGGLLDDSYSCHLVGLGGTTPGFEMGSFGLSDQRRRN